jgi:hypothetical protein
MAYRMVTLTPQVRIGITSSGEANIEVWSPHRNHPDAQITEVHVPADALEELAKFLIRNG